MRRIGIFTILLLVCLVVNGLAQEDTARLTVYAGAVKYNNPAFDSLVLVEFPFVLNRNEYEFFRPDTSDTNYYARIFAQVTLLNIEGKEVDSASTYFSVKVPTLQDARKEGLKLFNKLSLMIKPGIYSARVSVIDAVSKKEGEFFNGRLIVEPARANKLTIGGKSLAYSIKYVGDEQTPGDKMVVNGFQVLNCPHGIFSDEDSLVYLFAELYNLQYSQANPGKYLLAYRVIDENGDLYMDYGYKVRTKPGKSAVVTESFPIKNWPLGLYNIEMMAIDIDAGDSVTAYFPFRIISPAEVERIIASQTRAVDPYDNLSLEQKIEVAFYLMTPDQKITLDRLTDEGKINFLNQFWQERDPNPKTKKNELRLEMMRRFQFANHYFSILEDKTDGWKTDRGRIYMTYGPWEDIEDISAPIIGNPYVIWYYYSLEEGKVFVFEDQEGFNDFKLVHSNVDGEVYSAEWKERIQDFSTEIY